MGGAAAGCNYDSPDKNGGGEMRVYTGACLDGAGSSVNKDQLCKCQAAPTAAPTQAAPTAVPTQGHTTYLRLQTVGEKCADHAGCSIITSTDQCCVARNELGL